MFVGIVKDVKSGSGWFTAPCDTRSGAKVEALRIARLRGMDDSFKVHTKTLEAFNKCFGDTE